VLAGLILAGQMVDISRRWQGFPLVFQQVKPKTDLGNLISIGKNRCFP